MKKKSRDKELKDLLGALPQGSFDEVKLAFAKFGTEFTPEQEARLREILEKKKTS